MNHVKEGEKQRSPSEELIKKINEVAEELSEVGTKFSMDLGFGTASFKFKKKASIYYEEDC